MKSNNRWIYELIVAGILIPILLVSDVHKFFIIKLGFCSSTTNEDCINEFTPPFLLFWGLLCIIFIITIELACSFYQRKKRNNAIESKEYDSTPYLASIAFSNTSYPIITNCTAQLIQIRVINNQGCKKLFSSKEKPINDPRFFLWSNELTKQDIVRRTPEKIEIALVTKDERIILLTKNPIDFLPIYPDRRKNGKAKKVKYQLEINLSGNVISDGQDKVIENTSFWEIGYKADGEHYNSQNIWIKKINKLKNVNSLSLGEQITSVEKFKLILDDYPRKDGTNNN